MSETMEGSTLEPGEQEVGVPPAWPERRERPGRALREVPEHRRAAYLELVQVRAPDFPGPVARLFIAADEEGGVSGLVAESAQGQRVDVPFPHAPVVASECPVEPVRRPLLH